MLLSSKVSIFLTAVSQLCPNISSIRLLLLLLLPVKNLGIFRFLEYFLTFVFVFIRFHSLQWGCFFHHIFHNFSCVKQFFYFLRTAFSLIDSSLLSMLLIFSNSCNSSVVSSSLMVVYQFYYIIYLNVQD